MMTTSSKWTRAAVAAIAALALAGVARAQPTVRTASGIVRGVPDRDVSSFKGIP